MEKQSTAKNNLPYLFTVSHIHSTKQEKYIFGTVLYLFSRLDFAMSQLPLHATMHQISKLVIFFIFPKTFEEYRSYDWSSQNHVADFQFVSPEKVLVHAKQQETLFSQYHTDKKCLIRFISTCSICSKKIF